MTVTNPTVKHRPFLKLTDMLSS